jgi:glutamate racemase
MSVSASAPIGVFDSGVGGLSVLRQIRTQLPHENLIYLADQAHVPYGPRAKTEIRQFSEAITRFFLAQDAKLIVVACNTASAAALSTLRRTFPAVPFVGMEPAVKPAATRTQTGKVGVLATQGTFSSERYADLMARFAQDVEVYEDPCFGLVDLIESGQMASVETERVLRQVIVPMLAAGVDTIVLGCTHYPFVVPVLEKVAGTAVSIIDPAPAVVRQVERVLQRANLLAAKQPVRLDFFTTGSPDNFARQIQQLLGDEHGVKTAVWRKKNQELILQSDQHPL